MLDLISNRMKVLQEEINKVKQNIQNYSQNLDREKSLAIQLMGHFNEATHLYNEQKKLIEAIGENDGQ